jgi:predicted TPR repeat methyltransferase
VRRQKSKAGKVRGPAKAKAGAKDATTQGTLTSAIALHQQGELERAETVYLRVLEVDENNPDALHYLGVLRHQQGRSLLAIDLVRRAIEANTDYVDAYNNLGNIFQQLGNAADAAEAYERALALRPDHPQAARNLGMVLRKLKRFEESVDVHQRAIAQAPANVENFYGLATVYQEMNRFEEAIETLRKALVIKPEPDGFRRLGHMLYGQRRIDEAAANYEAWLRSDPDNPVAKHMLAACTLKDVPIRAENAFVTKVFDGFADTFDKVLHRLEYRAPALVGQALRRTDGEPRGELQIVDAGCGTGLLGQYLRPYARRLVGVDLSFRMLEKAAKRGLYDETIPAELGSFLRWSPEAFDIVASSDTLVYFGDLREVLAAARTSLRPGGRLLFTLEHASNEDQLPEGYRIHPHGRYSHTEGYVRRSLAAADFDVIDVEKASLRREGNSDVEGLVVSARRTSEPAPTIAGSE